MKISCRDRNELENIIIELKENIFCLNLIKYEIMGTRGDRRNTERYEILIALLDRFSDYIQNNSDNLETLQKFIWETNNSKRKKKSNNKQSSGNTEQSLYFCEPLLRSATVSRKSIKTFRIFINRRIFIAFPFPLLCHNTTFLVLCQALSRRLELCFFYFVTHSSYAAASSGFALREL